MTRITIFMGYLNDGLEEIGVLRFNMDILCMEYRLEVLMDSSMVMAYKGQCLYTLRFNLIRGQ